MRMIYFGLVGGGGGCWIAFLGGEEDGVGFLFLGGKGGVGVIIIMFGDTEFGCS